MLDVLLLFPFKEKCCLCVKMETIDMKRILLFMCLKENCCCLYVRRRMLLFMSEELIIYVCMWCGNLVFI